MPVVSVAKQREGGQNTPDRRLESGSALDRLRIGCTDSNSNVCSRTPQDETEALHTV